LPLQKQVLKLQSNPLIKLQQIRRKMIQKNSHSLSSKKKKFLS
jgi:hypothetical protein